VGLFNIFKRRYVEPKKFENYTQHDVISLDAWVSNVKDNNSDGINRQDILAKCKNGELLTFKLLETNNGYFEIEVYTEHGCIGFMYSKELQTIGRYIKNGGVIHNAKISEIKHPKTSRGKIECRFTFDRNKMR
jgi:hypothetical protein